MRAVIQRVLSASVTVDGKTISTIGQGLLVLVGIDRHDLPSDSTTVIKKILGAKLFDDEEGGMWKRSVRDVGGEVLCVSQFTLFANFKGTKPDFHESMSTLPGKAFYTSFIDQIRLSYSPDRIKDGQFGAMMQVSLCNDGSVTIVLSSRDEPSSSGSGTPETGDGEVRSVGREKAEQAGRMRVKRETKAGRAEVFRANREKNVAAAAEKGRVVRGAVDGQKLAGNRGDDSALDGQTGADDAH